MAVVLVLAVVTVAVVVASGGSDTPKAAAPVRATSDGEPTFVSPDGSAEVGAPAPDFALPALDSKGGTGTVKLSDYRGRPVMLNFWASWCNPCRREFPMFREQLAKADGKWALVGVNTQDFVKSDGQKFAKDQKATWPNGYDSDGAVKAGYSGSPGLPQTFFIDADGIIRSHLFGELTADKLHQELTKIGAT